MNEQVSKSSIFSEMLNDHYAEYWKEIMNVNRNLKESIIDAFKQYEQKDLVWVFK